MKDSDGYINKSFEGVAEFKCLRVIQIKFYVEFYFFLGGG
jgi:hypothetical protein